MVSERDFVLKSRRRKKEKQKFVKGQSIDGRLRRD
jgi:hypothetical protein